MLATIGMSNGAVVGGAMVFLAVAATSVIMFGNVGATANNLSVSLRYDSFYGYFLVI